MDRPVWLLDVDGVINVNKSNWHEAPFRATAACVGVDWKMRWSPSLLRRIRTLLRREEVEIRWCTSWAPCVSELERIFLLPQLPRTWTEHLKGRDVSDAKLAAARAVLSEGRRLIWTDDEEVPVFGPLYDELTKGDRGLLIRPVTRFGLQPEHMNRIEEFIHS